MRRNGLPALFGREVRRIHCVGVAGMGLTEAGYADLTGLVAGVAKRHAQGRILSCLEGGYNLTALAASVDAHLKALLAA